MTAIRTNYSLQELNTFGIPVMASHFCTLTSAGDVEEVAGTRVFGQNDHLILGGGSNILFTRDYEGLILHPQFDGLEILEESSSEVLLKVGAGVIWDKFVAWSVERNYGGLENLSGIPGNVGASPIQNIGAYGVEVSEAIALVEGFDLLELQWKSFSREDCGFSYRNSIFKREYRNHFLISHVHYRLRKTGHELVTHYGNIEDELQHRDNSIASLREIVLKIRNSKLPDVKILGNAGSFFKNPVVETAIADSLRQNFPDAPVFPAGEETRKLSAAWLIDKSGLKGFRLGNAATHDKQALVLVNLGNAKGDEILRLAEHIRNKVKSRFGIELVPEVNII